LPETIELWTVELDQPASLVAALERLLDPRESAAAGRRSEKHRSRYIVAHGAVRSILGRALDEDPARVRIERACEHCADREHGRPRLEGQPALQFSLSHSRDLGLVAVGEGPARVGVDVEVVEPRRSDLDRLAARVMCEGELEHWRTLPSTEHLRAFLAAWTAKEAYLKGLGLGVVRDPRSIPPQPDGWTLRPLDLGGDVDAVGTLAVEAADAEISRIARWSPPVP
jgi:4'-phosphopantetheinyl transferase